MRYTFNTMGKDGNRWYPEKFKWRDPNVPAPVSLLGFRWTTEVKKALTWDTIEEVETIAIEYEDTQILEITGNISKIYKVVKEAK